MIIGVTGFPRSGKDTVADYLAKKYKFTKLSINEPMRKMLSAMNPLLFQGMRVEDALLNHGYEQTKNLFPEYRRLLQKLGKEASRDIFGDNFWIDMALARARKFKNAVLSDVRFSNEAEQISYSGGRVFRTYRDGTEPASPHASDVGVIDSFIDYKIDNNGTLKDLHKAVDKYMKTLSPLIYTR